jgi:hypothetical protein
MSDILFDDEFTKYHELMIEKASGFIRKEREGLDKHDYTTGALAMFKEIMKIPREMAKTEEQTVQAQRLLDKALALYETKTMRSIVKDE